MLVYVNQAITDRTTEGKLNGETDLIEGIMEGAALRVRQVAMTVAVIIAGLLPIMLGQWHRLRGHAAHSGTDGWLYDYGAIAVDVRHSSGLPIHSPAESLR